MPVSEFHREIASIAQEVRDDMRQGDIDIEQLATDEGASDAPVIRLIQSMFQDAVQLTQKLIHEGKDFEEAYYPEEDHLFTRDETLIDAFRRTASFFDRWLQ